MRRTPEECVQFISHRAALCWVAEQEMIDLIARLSKRTGEFTMGDLEDGANALAARCILQRHPELELAGRTHAAFVTDFIVQNPMKLRKLKA